MKIEEYIQDNYPTRKQTQNNVRSQLNNYFDFIKANNPEQYLKQDRDFKKDVQKYWAHLQTVKTIRRRKDNEDIKKALSPMTITIYLSTIRQYLEEHDIVFSPRFWKKQSKRGQGTENILEDRIPSREELSKILTHGDARDRAFFLTMLSSGIRENELCQITLDLIDFNSKPVMITIPATMSKTKRKRFTFVSVEAEDTLREWLKIRQNYIEIKAKKSRGIYKYLEDKYGKKINGDDKDRLFPYQPSSPRMWWDRLLRKSGYIEKDKNTEYYTLHLYTLRKFFNTRMKDVCKRDMVEMWMGHKIDYDYNKWTPEEHKKEYLKGMVGLLIYRTPANLEELERLQQKVDSFEDVKDKFQKLLQNKLIQDMLKEK